MLKVSILICFQVLVINGELNVANSRLGRANYDVDELDLEKIQATIDIRNLILAGYVSGVVPYTKGAINVSIKLELKSIDEVSAREQRMVTSGRLDLQWRDRLLTWATEQFANVSSVLLAQDDLWLPDIVVANSISTPSKLGIEGLPCRIYSDGLISWRPAVVLVTSCSIDVAYFPFDTQICEIHFETFVTTIDEVIFALHEIEPLSLSNYTENGQWKLVGYKISVGRTITGENQVVFAFRLARRRAFYVLTIFVPVFILSLTGTLAFAVPAEAGEKMGMGLTVLLAYAVHLTSVSDQLPDTSVQVSVTAVYIITLMSIVALCIMMSVVILRLHHRPVTDKVGQKTEAVVICLKRLTYWRCDCFRKSSVVPMAPQENNQGFTADISKMEKDRSYTPAPFDYKDMKSGQTKVPSMTWVEVAEILDWFFFLLGSCLTFIVSVVCLWYLFVASEVSDEF